MLLMIHHCLVGHFGQQGQIYGRKWRDHVLFAVRLLDKLVVALRELTDLLLTRVLC